MSESRDEQITRLLPLVRRIARRVGAVTRAADAGDLLGDGSLGLIRAVDTYDPSRGTTLDVYARKLIAGAMLNGLRRLDPVSERVRRTLRRAEERRYTLAQELGTLPSLCVLEASDPSLRRARSSAHRQTPLSLDGPLPAGHDALLDCTYEPSSAAAQRAAQARLREAIALLPERERRILALHYGSELSLRTIGSRLAVSPQRVSQLHLGALMRLRKALPAP